MSLTPFNNLNKSFPNLILLKMVFNLDKYFMTLI